MISLSCQRRSGKLSRVNDVRTLPTGGAQANGSRVLSCYSVIIIVGIYSRAGFLTGPTHIPGMQPLLPTPVETFTPPLCETPFLADLIVRLVTRFATWRCHVSASLLLFLDLDTKLSFLNLFSYPSYSLFLPFIACAMSRLWSFAFRSSRLS